MEVKTITCYSLSLTSQDALAHLRILGPCQQAGIKVIDGMQHEQVVHSRVSDGDIVVVQRDFPKKFDDYQKIVEIAKRERKPIVFDLDDLLFFLPENHPNRYSQYYTSSLLPMFQAITEATLITVSTPKLRDMLSDFNENVVVLPNFLDDTLWHLKSPISKNSRKDVLTIGYMGGETHRPDLDFITPVLLNLAKH